MVLSVAACSPKEINFNELVYVMKSDSIELEEHTPDNSTVYVLVRSKDSNTEDIQAATEFSLRQEGYNITTNPSNAGYIVHINIAAIGTFSDAYLKNMVENGYGKVVELKSTMAEKGNKYAVIADVQVVARFIPPIVRRRPAVVTTTSKHTKLTEDSARIMAAIPEDEDYSLTQARPYLMQKLANNIVITLP